MSLDLSWDPVIEQSEPWQEHGKLGVLEVWRLSSSKQPFRLFSGHGSVTSSLKMIDDCLEKAVRKLVGEILFLVCKRSSFSFLCGEGREENVRCVSRAKGWGISSQR